MDWPAVSGLSSLGAWLLAVAVWVGSAGGCASVGRSPAAGGAAGFSLWSGQAAHRPRTRTTTKPARTRTFAGTFRLLPAWRAGVVTDRTTPMSSPPAPAPAPADGVAAAGVAAGAEDVRILLLSDSCHSGTVARDLSLFLNDAELERTFDTSDRTEVRALPQDVEFRNYQRDQELYDEIQSSVPALDLQDIKADVLLVSGCQDNQTSSDGAGPHGLFTESMLKTWKNGSFQGSYSTLHRQVTEAMPFYQSPNMFQTGKSTPSFLAQAPSPSPEPLGQQPRHAKARTHPANRTGPHTLNSQRTINTKTIAVLGPLARPYAATTLAIGLLIACAMSTAVAHSPSRRSTVTSSPEQARAQPGERGYPRRLRRRDHTRHAGVVAPGGLPRQQASLPQRNSCTT